MNEYRAMILSTKRRWIENEYATLLRVGLVSDVIHNWLQRDGGVTAIKDDKLDQFGDLICRTKEKGL